MLPLCERDDACLRAGLIESFAWLSHLDLLESCSDVNAGACYSEIGSVGIGHLVSSNGMRSVSWIPVIRRAAAGNGKELREGREAVGGARRDTHTGQGCAVATLRVVALSVCNSHPLSIRTILAGGIAAPRSFGRHHIVSQVKVQRLAGDGQGHSIESSQNQAHVQQPISEAAVLLLMRMTMQGGFGSAPVDGS